MSHTRATLALVVADADVQRGLRQDPDVPVSSASGNVAGPVKVPTWRAGLDERALPDGYRRLWAVLVQTAAEVRARDVVKALGLEPVPAKVEGARSKLKRLVRCGWAVESEPGAFRVAAGPAM